MISLLSTGSRGCTLSEDSFDFLLMMLSLIAWWMSLVVASIQEFSYQRKGDYSQAVECNQRSSFPPQVPQVDHLEVVGMLTPSIDGNRDPLTRES
jgi:hypothetical protein